MEYSSYESGYDQLNLLNENSKGWRSVEDCGYPQYFILVLELPCYVQYIDIILHQTKIPSIIHLFNHYDMNDATIKTVDQKKFKLLGHTTPDKNDLRKSEREFKRFEINSYVTHFMFKFEGYHFNKSNKNGQVAVISVKVYSIIAKPNESPEYYEYFRVKYKNFKSKVRNNSLQRVPEQDESENRDNIKMLSDNKILDIYIKNGLTWDLVMLMEDENLILRFNSLLVEKDKFIKNENYMAAKKCKAVVDKIKSDLLKILNMTDYKQRAIDREDYDSAKNYKDYIDVVLKNIRRRLIAIEERDYTVTESDNEYGFNEEILKDDKINFEVINDEKLINNDKKEIDEVKLNKFIDKEVDRIENGQQPKFDYEYHIEELYKSPEKPKNKAQFEYAKKKGISYDGRFDTYGSNENLKTTESERIFKERRYIIKAIVRAAIIHKLRDVLGMKLNLKIPLAEDE